MEANIFLSLNVMRSCQMFVRFARGVAAASFFIRHQYSPYVYAKKRYSGKPDHQQGIYARRGRAQIKDE